MSLVPSLTEAIAATDVALLAGATDWCTHPPGLDLPRVGGTKWPDLERVLALRPDLVVANAEENRDSDVAALRSAGVPVWVTAPATVAGALSSLDRLCAVLGRPDPAWLRRARAVWTDPPRVAPVRAVVPIWRRPWMVLGRDTFAGDVLRQLGIANAYAGAGERYPRTTVEEMRATGADLVVLPDEPYAFGPDDGPEEFGGLDVALVSGRHLTWYGPSLVEARDLLERQLAAARPAGNVAGPDTGR